jgi:hypothetical protein
MEAGRHVVPGVCHGHQGWEPGVRRQRTGDREVNVALRAGTGEAARAAACFPWRWFALVDKMREEANSPRTRKERP